MIRVVVVRSVGGGVKALHIDGHSEDDRVCASMSMLSLFLSKLVTGSSAYGNSSFWFDISSPAQRHTGAAAVAAIKDLVGSAVEAGLPIDLSLEESEA